MPSVTINEKGIVSESGSGFAVNDGPLTPHTESFTNSASFVLTCIPHDDGSLGEGDSGFEVSLNGTVDDGEAAGTFIGLYVAFKDGAGDDYYIWFNIDPANGANDVTTDPGVTGNATGTGFEVKANAEDAETADKLAALIATAVVSGFTVTAAADGSGEVTFLSLSMGALAQNERSLGDLINLGDAEESFAFSQTTQPTAAPALTGDFPAVRGELKGHGVSHLGSSAANALTVVLPAGPGAGVKKILRGTSVAAGTVTVSCTARHTGTRASNASTIVFNAATDTAVLMWNSVDELWEVINLTGVAMAN